MSDHEQEVDSCQQKTNIQEMAHSIWKRARHNAFAHKIAAAKANRRASILFVLEMFFSFMSISLVIFLYLV